MAQDPTPPSPFPSPTELIGRFNDKKKQNAGPLELGPLMKSMLETKQFTQAELPERLGISKGAVSESLGFLSIPEKARETFASKKLSLYILRNIKKELKPGDQERLAGELEQGLDPREIDGWIKTAAGASQKSNGSGAPVAAAPESAPARILGSGDQPEEPEEAAPVGAEGNSVGFVLLSDTVDELCKLATFWKYKLRFGRILVRWILFIREIGWLKTGLVFLIAAFTLVGSYQTSHFVYSQTAEFWYRFKAAAFPSQAGAGGSDSGNSLAAGPQVQHDLIDRNRLRLHWTSAGPDMAYRVYYHPAGADFDEPVAQDVSSLGADVDISPVWKKALITVTAIAPNSHESPHSKAIDFVLKPENQTNSVTPLEEGEQSHGTAVNQNGRLPAGRQGQPGNRPSGEAASGSFSKKEHLSPPSRTAAAQDGRPTGQPPSSSPAAPRKSGVWDILKNHAGSLIGSSINNPLLSQGAQTSFDLASQNAGSPAPADNNSPAPAAASSYPGPANLKWKPIPGSKNIQLTWQDLGAGYHYNLYASRADDPPSFDRDGYLLRQASTPWIPPAKGTQVFLFYVTAVNPQGQESAPSERIMADLR